MKQESQAYPASPSDATDEVRTPLSPEQERDHPLTYQLCRLGFGITSLALILACFCRCSCSPSRSAAGRWPSGS